MYKYVFGTQRVKKGKDPFIKGKDGTKKSKQEYY